jgi:dihydrofolate reductase
MPELVLIAAVGENLAIGKGLDLPWHLPEDLKRFKRLTSGFPLVMGRTTFDSLIHQFQKPLPKRPNVVITHQEVHYDYENVFVFTSIEAALSHFDTSERIFIGGGATIYRQMLEKCDRWELTIVEDSPEADVFFPEYRHLIGTAFQLVEKEQHDGFSFQTYLRVAP